MKPSHRFPVVLDCVFLFFYTCYTRNCTQFFWKYRLDLQYQGELPFVTHPILPKHMGDYCVEIREGRIDELDYGFLSNQDEPQIHHIGVCGPCFN